MHVITGGKSDVALGKVAERAVGTGTMSTWTLRP